MRKLTLVFCLLLSAIAVADPEVPVENLAARKLYQDCINDEPEACGNLGALFASGDIQSGKPNFERGFFYYAKACDLGVASRCLRAATFAAKGQGTVLSKDRAMQFLTRGCDIKDGECCNNLALLKMDAQFLDGILTKDKPQSLPEEVMSLFERACDYGSKNACRNLVKLKPRPGKK